MIEIFIRVGGYRVTLCERVPTRVDEDTAWHLQFHDMVTGAFTSMWFSDKSVATGVLVRWLTLELAPTDDVSMVDAVDAALREIWGISDFLP